MGVLTNPNNEKKKDSNAFVYNQNTERGGGKRIGGGCIGVGKRIEGGEAGRRRDILDEAEQDDELDAGGE